MPNKASKAMPSSTVTAPTTKKSSKPPTPFQQRVYNACRCIPKGRVSTYAALAHAVDCRAARAIGQAMRNNPFAPEVPCHRVISSSLGLGGFSGSWGIGCANVQRKKRMLASEGVLFTDDGRLATTEALLLGPELSRLYKQRYGKGNVAS